MTESLAKPKPLNARQEAFCQSYARHANATRAAKEAGYSEKTAYQQGFALLKLPEIFARIETIKADRFRAVHMSADETLALLAKRARFNMTGLIKLVDGAPAVDLENATEDQLAVLEEASLSDTGVLKIKGPNVTAALTTMMRHHGLLKDKVVVEASEEFAAMMERAQRRAKEARGDNE